MGSLEGGFATVLHELGILTGKYDETKAPVRVTQHTASQEDLVVVQGVRLVLPLHHPFKLTQPIVGRLTEDFT